MYNNSIHSELHLSPSEFILTKAHNISTNLPLLPKLTEKWRVGHPNFAPFRVGQLVLMKVQHKGHLTVNKLSANFRGPLKVTKVHENGLTYVLEDVSSNESVRGHHSKLRLYKQTPTYVSSHPRYVELGGYARGELEYGSITDEVAPMRLEVGSTGSSDSEAESIVSSVPSMASSGSGVYRILSSDAHSNQSFVGFESPRVNDSNNSDKSNVIQSENRCLCRGCNFEATLETEAVNRAQVHDLIFSPRFLPEVTAFGESDIIYSLPNFNEVYSLAFDWEAYDDFELPSVDSQFMLDESAEVTDPEIALYNCSNNSSISNPAGDVVPFVKEDSKSNIQRDVTRVSDDDEIPMHTVNHDLFVTECAQVSQEVPNLSPGSGEAAETSICESVFDGFEEDSSISDNILKLKEVQARGLVKSLNSLIRHTRSRGAVEDLPNVQSHTLERANNRKKRRTSS